MTSSGEAIRRTPRVATIDHRWTAPLGQKLNDQRILKQCCCRFREMGSKTTLKAWYVKRLPHSRLKPGAEGFAPTRRMFGRYPMRPPPHQTVPGATSRASSEGSKSWLHDKAGEQVTDAVAKRYRPWPPGLGLTACRGSTPAWSRA